MDTHLPNRPTLDALRHMPVSDIIALPAEHLARLQTDAREALDAAKRMQDWIGAAIALRFEQRAVGARAAAGKDTGTVRFQDGSVEIAVDLPKKVERDQARLAALIPQIRAGSEDPAEYVETSFKVSERAYTACSGCRRRHQRCFMPIPRCRWGRGSLPRRWLGTCRRWPAGRRRSRTSPSPARGRGDLAQASLVSSTRFIDLTAFAWTNNSVRVMARNISGATFDLAAATLSVQVVKRRVA